MLYLRHSLFADFVTDGVRNKPVIVGVFDTLFLPREALGQPLGGFYAFLQVEGSIADGSHHQLTIALVDEVGARAWEPVDLDYTLVMSQQAPGDLLSGKVILQVVGLQFKEYGEYTLEVYLAGRRVPDGPTLKVVAPLPPPGA